jgi:hypothetical protein
VSECNYGCVTVQPRCVWLGRLLGLGTSTQHNKCGARGCLAIRWSGEELLARLVTDRMLVRDLGSGVTFRFGLTRYCLQSLVVLAVPLGLAVGATGVRALSSCYGSQSSSYS